MLKGPPKGIAAGPLVNLQLGEEVKLVRVSVAGQGELK